MRLTIAQLRKYPGCDSLTEEKAKEVIEALFQISNAFYESYLQFKNTSHEQRSYKFNRQSKTNQKA